MNTINGSSVFAIACTIAWGMSGAARPALAAGDLTDQDPIQITVKLGDADDALRFFPDTVTVETGKLYTLRLVNPSPQKHYFSSDKFAQGVLTRKVQSYAPGGMTISEVKGFIREIEVYPGGVTEWWFVPVKAGSWNDLKCTIAGHAEKGMVGTIVSK